MDIVAYIVIKEFEGSVVGGLDPPKAHSGLQRCARLQLGSILGKAVEGVRATNP